MKRIVEPPEPSQERPPLPESNQSSRFVPLRRYQFYFELALHTLSVACFSGNAAMLRFQDLESRGLWDRVGDLLAQNVTLAISTMFLLQDILNLYNRRR